MSNDEMQRLEKQRLLVQMEALMAIQVLLLTVAVEADPLTQKSINDACDHIVAATNSIRVSISEMANV
jgi:hypothetical protein